MYTYIVITVTVLTIWLKFCIQIPTGLLSKFIYKGFFEEKTKRFNKK